MIYNYIFAVQVSVFLGSSSGGILKCLVNPNVSNGLEGCRRRGSLLNTLFNTNAEDFELELNALSQPDGRYSVQPLTTKCNASSRTNKLAVLKVELYI
jgi:hypothetical protein